ncbi:MAG: BlaI/MecI/CopY family transcriptional regulator [Caulobacteraceae bacterium]|nr:BlaI/MecI/CopY family transcriptional regulator [Caulobacteraceae bacterium]
MMTRPLPRISTAESQVMEVLWAEAPRTSEQIVDALIPHPDWTGGTVRTLIQRLLKKEAITARPEGRRFLYSPAVSRADYVAAESRGVLDRLFGGDLAAMVLHFAERENLPPERIEQFKRIVSEIENES